MRRAFTIIELLIVVATIALVVSLTLPTLGDLRWRAQDLKSIANLRSHAALIATYAGDERDYFHFFTDPDAHTSIVRGGGWVIPTSHFNSFHLWNVALADTYLDGNALSDAMLPPWQERVGPFTAYWYGDCFISRPDFWRLESRRAGTSQWRATTTAEVLFPSQKGLVLEGAWYVRGRYGVFDGPRLFCLVDGSANRFRSEQVNRPIIRGVAPFGCAPPHYCNPMGFPVTATVDGVYGRDVR